MSANHEHPYSNFPADTHSHAIESLTPEDERLALVSIFSHAECLAGVVRHGFVDKSEQLDADPLVSSHYYHDDNKPQGVDEDIMLIKRREDGKVAKIFTMNYHTGSVSIAIELLKWGPQGYLQQSYRTTLDSKNLTRLSDDQVKTEYLIGGIDPEAVYVEGGEYVPADISASPALSDLESEKWQNTIADCSQVTIDDYNEMREEIARFLRT